MADRAESRRPGARRPGRAGRRRLHILITAGPTREYFDTIRYISNPSSGRMGYALAEAATAAGHAVTLVSGPVALPRPDHPRIKTIAVETAEEMLSAARRAFGRADAAVFAAAVCDYRPRIRARRKLPKARRGFRLDLESTADIAATLGAMKRGRQVTICFALQDHDGRRHAERKLVSKYCDAVVLNGPENVGRERAVVEFLARDGHWQRWPAGRKTTVARRIIAWLGKRVRT